MEPRAHKSSATKENKQFCHRKVVPYLDIRPKSGSTWVRVTMIDLNWSIFEYGSAFYCSNTMLIRFIILIVRVEFCCCLLACLPVIDHVFPSIRRTINRFLFTSIHACTRKRTMTKIKLSGLMIIFITIVVAVAVVALTVHQSHLEHRSRWWVQGTAASRKKKKHGTHTIVSRELASRLISIPACVRIRGCQTQVWIGFVTGSLESRWPSPLEIGGGDQHSLNKHNRLIGVNKNRNHLHQCPIVFRIERFVSCCQWTSVFQQSRWRTVERAQTQN